MKKINITHTDPQIIQALSELTDYFMLTEQDGYTVVYEEILDNKTSIIEDGAFITIQASSFPKMLQALFLHVSDHSELITTSHAFSKNGLMIDHSRNAVMNVKTVKKTIRQMALLGHTWLFMYMEDVYELPDYPHFGAYRGRYTQDELKEIDRYAQLFGIEVIPCIQTLAHLNQFLYWEHIHQKYVDIDDILNVNSKDTKSFIEAMLKFLSETFTSNKIHLGMDEAYNLGRGNYLDEVGLKPKPQIMREHLDFLTEVCEQYNLELMIWDDMFFSHYSNIENQENYRLPDKLSLVYWDYYNIHEAHYDERFTQRKALGNDVIFAGGAWRWVGYTPHHMKTLLTTQAALTNAKQHEIDRVFVTTWGDDGDEAPFNTMLFGTILFAYLDHNEKYNEDDFDKWLQLFSGLTLSQWLLQGTFDLLPNLKPIEEALDVNPSKYLLYQDLLSPLFLEQIDALNLDYGKHMMHIREQLEQFKGGEALVNEFYIQYAELLAVKWDLPKQIYNAYHQQDKSALAEIAKHKLPLLMEQLEKTLEARRQVWLCESKPQGLEIIEYRFGGMIQRVKAVQSRIKDYIEGTILSIPELEDERVDPLPNSPKGPHGIVEYNRAMKIMSRNRMDW